MSCLIPWAATRGQDVARDPDGQREGKYGQQPDTAFPLSGHCWLDTQPPDHDSRMCWTALLPCLTTPPLGALRFGFLKTLFCFFLYALWDWGHCVVEIFNLRLMD